MSVSGCVVLAARGEKELLQVYRLPPSCLSLFLSRFLWFIATGSCVTRNTADNKRIIPVLSSLQNDVHNSLFMSYFLLPCIVLSMIICLASAKIQKYSLIGWNLDINSNRYGKCFLTILKVDKSICFAIYDYHLHFLFPFF